MKTKVPFLASLVAMSVLAGPSETGPESAPTADRVGFPKGYADAFAVLRVVNKPKEHKVVTVYGNAPAASVTNLLQLPYPYGSIVVMESASTIEDDGGKLALDPSGKMRKGGVTGLHVMRKEQGFGKEYGKNQAGEWEYVEYKPDGSYITPPSKSATCAECHVKAGVKRDFVYQGRLAAGKKGAD